MAQRGGTELEEGSAPAPRLRFPPSPTIPGEGAATLAFLSCYCSENQPLEGRGRDRYLFSTRECVVDPQCRKRDIPSRRILPNPPASLSGTEGVRQCRGSCSALLLLCSLLLQPKQGFIKGIETREGPIILWTWKRHTSVFLGGGGSKINQL